MCARIFCECAHAIVCMCMCAILSSVSSDTIWGGVVPTVSAWELRRLLLLRGLLTHVRISGVSV